MWRRRAWLAASAGMLAGCAVAAPRDGAAALRIGVASCADQGKPQPIWDAVLAQRPDFFVFAGDNVYASDTPFDIARLRQAYAALAAKDNFERLRTTTTAAPSSSTSRRARTSSCASGASAPTTRVARARACTTRTRSPSARAACRCSAWTRAGSARSSCPPTSAVRRAGSATCPTPMPARRCWATRSGAGSRRACASRRTCACSSAACNVSSKAMASSVGATCRSNENACVGRSATPARAACSCHIGGIYREANATLPYPLYELTSSGVTHPWTTAREAGPNRIGPLVTVVHYGLVELDFAARRVTLGLRDVNDRPLHQHTIALDELQIA